MIFIQIAAFAQNTEILINSTIKELRENKMISYSARYYTTNIGQEGFWYYDATDNTSADNTGTILVSSNGKRFKRIHEGKLNARWFGAVGDSITDNSVALQNLLQAEGKAYEVFFPNGIYAFNTPLIFDGTKKSITLYSSNGQLVNLDGGNKLNTTATLMWTGAANNIMLKITDGNGIIIQGLGFTTKSSAENQIQIDAVTAIQFVNKFSTRYSNIIQCNFRRLSVGIHFFDDGSNFLSNSNMDGHTITDCVFGDYVKAIVIQQTNVYNTSINQCSFYGSPDYSKHHLHIIKGHASFIGGYFGTLKGASSVGGKNGVGIQVDRGSVDLVNPYSETHTAPFLVWDIAEPAQATSTISGGVGILQDLSLLPTTYSILNKTSSNLNIISTHITGTLRKEGAGGSIATFNVLQPRFEGNLALCMRYGTNNDKVGLVGTASGSAGVLSQSSDSTVFNFYLNSGYNLQSRFTKVGSNFIRQENLPGIRTGFPVNYSTGTVDYALNNWNLFVPTQSTGDSSKLVANTEWVKKQTATIATNVARSGITSTSLIGIGNRMISADAKGKLNTDAGIVNATIINASSGAALAGLTVKSTTNGSTPAPVMTSLQKIKIANPTAGKTVYCSDCVATDSSTGVMQTYNGKQWKNHW